MDFVIKKLKKLRPTDRKMATPLFLLRCAVRLVYGIGYAGSV